MKFAATAVLILTSSWAAAELSWEERSLQEGFVPDGYGPRGPSSYGGPSYKPFKEPNGWIIQNFQGMPGSGFEVEKGYIIDFESVSTPRPPPPMNGNKGSGKNKPVDAAGDTVEEQGSGSKSRSNGRMIPPTPEGICSENLCYQNVYAIVKGHPFYGGYEAKGESIKLCLVDSGASCWSVTCPSAKLKPYVKVHSCYEAESYCWCTVSPNYISYNTVEICVRTMDHKTCGIIRQQDEGGADVDGKGCCALNESELSAEHCSQSELFESDGKKKGPRFCPTGSVASVEIECKEPYYD